MKFEKVALIGCGLMGGSFALAAREAGWAQHIVGYSASASLKTVLRKLCKVLTWFC
ncbi:MAG: T-protein [Pseudomonadota bacterium]